MQQVMNQYADNVRANSKRLVAETALDAATQLARATPVDEGTARSNWITSIGSPTNVVIPPYAPGSHLGRGETTNLNYVRNQARSVAARYVNSRFIFSLPSMFVSNSVIYIGKLNDGWSRQARPGMVPRALQIVTTNLKTRVGSLLTRLGATKAP